MKLNIQPYIDRDVKTIINKLEPLGFELNESKTHLVLNRHEKDPLVLSIFPMLQSFDAKNGGLVDTIVWYVIGIVVPQLYVETELAYLNEVIELIKIKPLKSQPVQEYFKCMDMGDNTVSISFCINPDYPNGEHIPFEGKRFFS